MKDQYAGDIGDFSKYAVIQGLANEGHRVGLMWYRTHDDARTDGRFREYLDSPWEGIPEYGQALLKDLKWFREGHRGGVADLNRRLQRTKANHADVLCWTPDCRDSKACAPSMTSAQRHAHRALWFDRALRSVVSSNVVIMDPDNGLIRPGGRPYAATGPKFATPSEVRAVLDGGQACIVYQHATRRNFADVIQDKLSLIDAKHAFALRWRRQQARAYLVFDDGYNHMPQWGKRFAKEWAPHFEFVPRGT